MSPGSRDVEVWYCVRVSCEEGKLGYYGVRKGCNWKVNVGWTEFERLASFLEARS